MDNQHELINDVESVLFSEEQIKEKILELGNRISNDYKDKKPILLGILKGSYVFLSDLARKVSINHNIEFMAVSSYANQSQTTGNVKIELDLRTNIENRHVIIVEDILDSGLTLKNLIETLSTRKPASLEIVVLLRKPKCVKTEVNPKYLGWDIEPHFVVGYGLDYAETYRSLPFLGILKKSVYSNK
eukprot:TRINITY_DN8966_c0_g1_i1.p1 TRINITY_DN8966_c0_g1~~TRINITY_DN8966_c0_g1_i1.p1  ORF type:complete len:187 (+),score=43.74 TRINITY_DN8966_c0_g1_i1:12-572(+)